MSSNENNRPIKTVLLVGASGYIGRHVALRLVEKELNVICLFRKAPELENPPRNKYVTNLVVDLDNKEKSEFMHSIDAVKKLWEAASKIDPDLNK